MGECVVRTLHNIKFNADNIVIIYNNHKRHLTTFNQ